MDAEREQEVDDSLEFAYRLIGETPTELNIEVFGKHFLGNLVSFFVNSLTFFMHTNGSFVFNIKFELKVASQ